jgi:hypothetical protein
MWEDFIAAALLPTTDNVHLPRGRISETLPAAVMVCKIIVGTVRGTEAMPLGSMTTSTRLGCPETDL